MTKIKVLLLMHTLGLSGAPKIALDAVEQMGDAVEVRTLTLEGGPLEARCRTLGPLDFLYDPAHNRFPRRVRQPLGKKKLEATLRQWQPDVIYANSIASLVLVQSLALPSAPALLHVHELETAFDYFGPAITQLAAEWPRHYLAVSQPVRDLLMQRCRVEEAKISLVYEFVRDADFRDVGLQTLTPREAGVDTRFVVGGAGTPNWRKGKSQWLELASELKARVGEDKVRFVWVGVKDDADSIDFRTEARLRHLESMVEFVPVTPEPFEYFLKFDVFAMTSWDDPCPVVVLESMMLQKPVLCFAGGGGASEEVGSTGIVVENFSPAAMADAVAGLMADPARGATLGKQARDRVENKFTASVQVPLILEAIQCLVGVETITPSRPLSSVA